MAHMISFANGRAEMAYSGDTPWHGLGTKVDGLKTAQEMIEAAGLGWTVSARTVYRGVFGDAIGEVKEVQGYRVIVRDDNDVDLGMATSRYVPIQNTKVADVMDALVTDGGAQVEVCGALDHGRRCWMLAHIPADFEVLKGDLVKPYMLLAWGHDGKHGLAGKLTPIRVVCNNTLTAAGFGGGAKWSESADIYVRHTGDATLNIEAAQAALGLAHRQVVKTAEAYQALAATALTYRQADQYFADVFPKPGQDGDPLVQDDSYEARLARWNARQAEIMELYQRGAGAELATGTAWGAYNAVTEHIDHVQVVLKSGEVSPMRQRSALFGPSAEIKSAALVKALDLVGK